MTELSSKAKHEHSANATYTLWMLMAVYMFSFLDRQIISILAQDIKTDLALSDTQLGLLTGLAFALFYATLGLPLARIADKYNRVKLISICLSLWSLMTMASGLAANFIQLALARMGVGIGEAGALPSSHSIIADTVPPEKRSSAMAIFQMGVPAGVLFGFLIGGWVNEWIGWRWALLLVGAPGLVLALLLYLTVREPKRGRFESNTNKSNENEQSFSVQFKDLVSKPAYIFIGIGATLASMGGYCILAWVPAMLIRDHGVSTGLLGTMLSLMIGAGGMLGTYLAGRAGDKMARKSLADPLKLCIWITLGCAPLFTIGFLIQDLTSAILVLTPAYILFLAWMGPNWAMVQAVASDGTRAMASALILLLINLVGLGLGPLLVGMLSDYFQSIELGRPLNWALVVSLVVYPLAAVFYGLALRTMQTTRKI